MGQRLEGLFGGGQAAVIGHNLQLHIGSHLLDFVPGDVDLMALPEGFGDPPCLANRGHGAKTKGRQELLEMLYDLRPGREG